LKVTYSIQDCASCSLSMEYFDAFVWFVRNWCAWSLSNRRVAFTSKSADSMKKMGHSDLIWNYIHFILYYPGQKKYKKITILSNSSMIINLHSNKIISNNMQSNKRSLAYSKSSNIRVGCYTCLIMHIQPYPRSCADRCQKIPSPLTIPEIIWSS
jgi:hypothetical protein